MRPFLEIPKTKKRNLLVDTHQGNTNTRPCAILKIITKEHTKTFLSEFKNMFWDNQGNQLLHPDDERKRDFTQKSMVGPLIYHQKYPQATARTVNNKGKINPEY